MENFEKYHSELIDKMYNAYILFEVITNENGCLEDLLLIEFNKEAEKIFDINKSQDTGKKLSDLHFGGKYNKWRDFFDGVYNTNEEREKEYYNPVLFKWYVVKAFKCDENHIISISYETTEEKENQRMLREMINTLPVWIAYMDMEGRYKIANEKFAQFFGKPLEQIIGKKNKDIISAEMMESNSGSWDKHRLFLKGCMQGNITTFDDEIKYNGESIFLHGVGVPVKDQNGKINGVVLSIMDITELKKYQNQLMFMSTHDILTGLYNRNFYNTEIERLKNSRSYPITIFMADVNELKKTNDLQGHEAGDQLLIKTAQILKATFRAEDIIARIGGDEFAVILPKTDYETGEKILKRMKNILDKQNESNGNPKLSLAVGFTTAEVQDDFYDCIREADKKMYEDKMIYYNNKFEKR